MIMTLHKIHSSIFKIAKKEGCHQSASFIFNVIHIFIKVKQTYQFLKNERS